VDVDPDPIPVNFLPVGEIRHGATVPALEGRIAVTVRLVWPGGREQFCPGWARAWTGEAVEVQVQIDDAGRQMLLWVRPVDVERRST
jgi:hypothetical protein